jgi:hypothetical protein
VNPATSMTLEDDRVRAVSSVDSNLRIDVQTAYNISRYKRQDKRIIARRIEELDREWDVERVLQVNGAVLTLTGLVLGLTVNKKWFLLPGIALPMLLQQGIQGWCPPLPLLRRLGLRTRLEINREKHALEPLLT